MKTRLTKKALLLTVASLGVMGLMSSCSTKDVAPVELSWTDFGLKGEGIYENQFVIRNTSDKPLEGNFTLYYSQLPRGINSVESPEMNIEKVNANYFKMTPTAQFKPIQPGDSLVVKFTTGGYTFNISNEPEGAYVVIDGQQPMAVKLENHRPQVDYAKMAQWAERTYHRNELLKDGKASGVLPAVKQQTMSNGECEAVADADVKQVKGEVAELTTDLQKAEGYKLVIAADGVTITAPSDHGLFNGLQTYRALQKDGSKKLACRTVIDYPDLEYRGFMLDIARNYTSVQNIRNMIDVMSSYKLNRLHLHLAEDEGWRLEIPGLEELTSVASRRGHTLDESECIYPGYDGNYDPTAATSGNGFITRAEFIDLLKYAAEHFVTIIPEVDTPGHSRAAIKAMNARYEKYAKTDLKKAEEYLLEEKGDTSKYESAQGYGDCVINMAMPSTYHFIEKVVTEIKAMYDEAGVPLTTFHLGGDECADGAWLGSSLCQKLMAEKGYTTTHELYQQFYLKVNGMMKKLGISISGWQEAAFIADGKNPELATQIDEYKKNVAGVYCWNTVAEWGGDVIPYDNANAGYPVILCNVTNFYVDLAYSPLYDERGLKWGGYVDESKSFAVLPYNIYRSARINLKGEEWNLDSVSAGKPMLTEDSRPNIKGVQAQLFSETIRDYKWVEYYVFPKILGLVDRGWNAHPAWEGVTPESEERTVFYKALSDFYAQLSKYEFPYLTAKGVNYHLPSPGMIVKEGKLMINGRVEGAEIRYTVDGSEPTKTSPLWEAPLDCPSGIIKAKLFYLDKESNATVIKN